MTSDREVPPGMVPFNPTPGHGTDIRKVDDTAGTEKDEPVLTEFDDPASPGSAAGDGPDGKVPSG